MLSPPFAPSPGRFLISTNKTKTQTIPPKQSTMADESMDIDTFDPADTDIVHGGGGYVDDDIDIDDDDDDEPLVSSTSRHPPSPTINRLPKPLKRRADPNSPSLLPQLKKHKKSIPHPDDFLLRASGTGDYRDYVVAKFVTRVPDFADNPHVRLYRNTEATVSSRKKGIEANRKQQIFYNSFTGKQRLKRYAKQGIVSIPDRYRNSWTMEITPAHLVNKHPSMPPVANNLSASGHDRQNPPADPSKPPTDPNVDVFTGTFDGKSTSRYAIMVMSAGSKTVDVVPIDEYAWFSFRTSRAQGGDQIEDMEARMARRSRKGENRLSKFQVKYEGAQEERERNMGDSTRIKNNKDYAGFGIRRSRTTRQVEEDAGKEELDYEVEFANDDVAQVDLETVEKPETRILDTEQNAKDFDKLIKDEPITSRPASPGSESEEDPSQRRTPNQQSRSPSPSRPVSASRSPNRSNKASPRVASRQVTPSGATPFGVSPSPRSPRGNTPQKLNLSHLIPPAGILPTAQHVTAVLRVLLANKQRIPLKEVLQYFERKTKEQKANLTKVLKEVAVVTADPKNKKNFYIHLKSSGAPSGLPSGR